MPLLHDMLDVNVGRDRSENEETAGWDAESLRREGYHVTLTVRSEQYSCL
jgi:hypothetical protein